MGSTRSKKVKRINRKTLVASLDIGKGFHYAYFRAPNGNDIEPFSFPNNGYGFKDFWQRLQHVKSQYSLEEVVIGFESSGPYAEPLFHYLEKKPIKLVQINPMHSKRIKELTGNSPHKTDRKDPRVIADVISLGHALTVVIPQGAAAHLRRLTQARERAMKSRTAVSNQLHDAIFVIFPEFLQVMKNTRTKTSMYLIKHHPVPESITRMGVKSLSTVLKRISRGNLMHEVFSLIRTHDDVDRALETIMREGWIAQSEKEGIGKQIRLMLQVEPFRQWFSGRWEVMAERDILNREGVVKRPDRVMVRGDRAIVLDYKFGMQKSAGHKIQVRQYMDVLFDIYFGNKRSPDKTLALLDLLRFRAVMKYNGEGFYDTHPLLEDFIKLYFEKYKDER